ncbi:hypothetical protein DSM112329_02248 [Paraconexibacter sp. AEG42_29]|uniref:Uncharacterized protein n=1 Tax=Paraconexibacter sp. AEG42_29 TaxID=2997339 RepID=A0AAU7AV98_9ACTN
MTTLELAAGSTWQTVFVAVVLALGYISLVVIWFAFFREKK